MNEQIINELLKQLKSNLENVESARLQVEETIGAYNALEGQVDGFVKELGAITQNTSKIINQLEDVKKNFISNVSTNLEKKITQGVDSIKANTDVAKNEVLQYSNEIKLDVDTVKTDLSAKITTESTTVLNKIDSVENTITSNIQNTNDTITNALSGSEQRIIQQVKEKGVALQTDISNSSKSLKRLAYWMLGLSFVTICLAIYIVIKI